ncbi:hypothetical protein AB4Z09_20965 [Rhodococcus sp. TAF43]|uniref:hypothetical protein n=1 Tax=unclassified Rhodococcus (in: high G+C Gram-positive bacteria) TaxID=192944 RepID=UPI000E0C9666|nr:MULTISPECIES: hypothetical protein [unclassified Rhodococcus (in: high G+C Gram-positive bacteria)]QKT10622.1 hypothetical protein HUN07_07725 [Rhodococcus sp. W8901]RDI35764.1 hypothetical protein DEU38_101244 [Rhodococcus sp. AG1013]
MHYSTVHSPVGIRPASSGARREHARGRSAALRARALEIVGILYRCEPDAAAQLLMRHSQENNLKVAALSEALVAVVDGASDEPDACAQTTLAAHFWLREIRRLGRTHRRSDRWVRHVAASGGCVSGSRTEARKSSVRQSDPNRVDFLTQV